MSSTTSNIVKLSILPCSVSVLLCLVLGSVECQEPGNSVGAIPGQAGRDYPNFSEIPGTSFTCLDLSPGYYADPEGECQVNTGYCSSIN